MRGAPVSLIGLYVHAGRGTKPYGVKLRTWKKKLSQEARRIHTSTRRSMDRPKKRVGPFLLDLVSVNQILKERYYQ